MLTSMLRLHWRSSRAWILAAVVAAIALPLGSVAVAWPRDPALISNFLAELSLWSLLYPTLAAILGLVMGSLVWRADRRGGFIYALTLPIDRRRYVALRLVSGAVWIGAIATALWIAALAAVAFAAIPDSLRSFATVLAVKFLLAALSIYAFASLGASLPARTRVVIGWIALILAVAQVAMLMLGGEHNFARDLAELLLGRRGPLGLLGGRWMLVDV